MKMYFAYSPFFGMEFFESEEIAKAVAQIGINMCRTLIKNDGDFDDDLASGICWGTVSEMAKNIEIDGWNLSDDTLSEV